MMSRVPQLSLFPVLGLAIASLFATAPLEAQRRVDQQQMIDQLREGRILPLQEIERRVLPTVSGARYIGFDFDGVLGIYTLKFLRNGNVIWVEVDGRTGRILGRIGN